MDSEGGAPTVEFAKGRARTGELSLEWPITVNGELVRQITVRRITGGEMVGIQALTEQEGFDDAALFAMICDQPAEVLRMLDGDDWIALREVALNFLPRAFREAFILSSKAQGN